MSRPQPVSPNRIRVEDELAGELAKLSNTELIAEMVALFGELARRRVTSAELERRGGPIAPSAAPAPGPSPAKAGAIDASGPAGGAVDPPHYSLNLDALLLELMEEEGVSLRPYRDTRGFLTIGVGHNLDASPLAVSAVREQLRVDVEKAELDLRRLLPWVLDLDPVRQQALVDLAFNMGAATLVTFTVFLRELRNGDFVSAAADLRTTLWSHEVGSKRTARIAGEIETGRV